LNIEKLSPLLGLWKGKGNAEFPTINSTDYNEELEFSRIEKNHVLNYIQRTWYRPESFAGAVPLHWESGYIKVLDDGSYQLSNSQDNGRVEVLVGNIIENNNEMFHIKFESKHIGNDERMIKTSRDFIVSGNTLKYLVKMATQKTPEFQDHLKAELIKVS
jgi:nitrobindin-like protein